MKLRNTVIQFGIAVMLFSLSGSIGAQQPKVPRIGYLTGTRAPTVTAPDINADAFRQGLREHGYIEGKNILVEYRYVEAKEDRVPSLLAELLQLKVEALEAHIDQRSRQPSRRPRRSRS